MPHVKIRLSNEIYEALLKLATERGVSIDEYAGWVVVDHVMRPGTDAKAELSRLEKWVKEIDGRLSLVEKYMEDVLSAKTPTSTPRAQAPQAPQQPQFQPPQQPPAPQPPEPAPKLMPASELPEARKALEEVERAKAEEAKPEEAVGIGKRSREGVFKELTVKWILEKAKKDPDQFVEEWVRKGYNANRVGDRVVIASDDVIESVVNELNARGVQGPGALQGIEDKDLKRKATAISAAGFIYFDAVTKTWKRT